MSNSSDFIKTFDSIALNSSLPETNGNQGTSHFSYERNEELQKNSCSAIDLSNFLEQTRNQTSSTFSEERLPLACSGKEISLILDEGEVPPTFEEI
ncbi:MAG: hypothetical protein LBU02_00640 [Rickettsiales bacterium]|jgi:hypothetical protein|nr:hypothetical protein [Rickettsiales bacterium]